MRTVAGIILGSIMGANAWAQTPAQAPAPAAGVRMLSEISAGTERIVKGAPFTADAISESIQVLADGNRIVRSSTSKLYRNSEGRFRRDLPNGSGGLFGSVYSFGSGMTILDPVVGFRYHVDDTAKTAVQGLFRAVPPADTKAVTEAYTAAQAATRIITAERPAVAEAERVAPEARKLMETKVAEAMAARPAVTVVGSTAVTAATAASPASPTMFSMIPGPATKYETRSENLGTQTIEGVSAEGTRTTTIIPAGAIGNERPIEIVYERWYSPELQVVVMSTHHDPRYGEQNYKLTNINRTEPDPSLFAPPAGYKIVSERGVQPINRTSPARVDHERAVRPEATVRRPAQTTYVKRP